MDTNPYESTLTGGRRINQQLPGRKLFLVGCEKENLNWRSFDDDGTINRKWSSPPTPTFYVLDAQGMIRHK